MAEQLCESYCFSNLQVERQIMRALMDHNFEHDSELENLLVRIDNTATTGASNPSQQANQFPESQDFNRLINDATDISGGKQQQENDAVNVHGLPNVDGEANVGVLPSVEVLANMDARPNDDLVANVHALSNDDVEVNVDSQQNVETGDDTSNAIDRLDSSHSMPTVAIYAANCEEMIFEADSVQNSETLEASFASQLNFETSKNVEPAQPSKSSQDSSQNPDSASSSATSSQCSGMVPDGLHQLDQALRRSSNLPLKFIICWIEFSVDVQR